MRPGSHCKDRKRKIMSCFCWLGDRIRTGRFYASCYVTLWCEFCPHHFSFNGRTDLYDTFELFITPYVCLCYIPNSPEKKTLTRFLKCIIFVHIQAFKRHFTLRWFQRDLNSDCQSSWRASWPLDQRHGQICFIFLRSFQWLRWLRERERVLAVHAGLWKKYRHLGKGCFPNQLPRNNVGFITIRWQLVIYFLNLHLRAL